MVSQYLQKLAEQGSVDMKGVALLCSVPPSGSGGIVGRYFLRKPLTAIDITLVLLRSPRVASSLSLSCPCACPAQSAWLCCCCCCSARGL